MRSEFSIFSSVCVVIAVTVGVKANSFLDVYLRVHPVDDFCGAQKCNLTYAISVLVAQNQFDLQSVMLQDGEMNRNHQELFEDNTVIRLTRDLRNAAGKVYLGLMLFDVPDDIQDYVVVDVTDVIHKDRRVKVAFATETVRIALHVYKRSESMLFTEMVEKVEAVASDLEEAGFKDEKDRSHLPSTQGNGCVCKLQSCSCCRHFDIRKIRLDDTVCVNVTYAPPATPKEAGATLTMKVGSHTFNPKLVPLSNEHSSFCHEVPHLREYASVCIKPYNMGVHDGALTGCFELEARLYHVKVARTKLGCFRAPLADI